MREGADRRAKRVAQAAGNATRSEREQLFFLSSIGGNPVLPVRGEKGGESSAFAKQQGAKVKPEIEGGPRSAGHKVAAILPAKVPVETATPMPHP